MINPEPLAAHGVTPGPRDVDLPYDAALAELQVRA
jgi:hypothetical protein